MKATAKIWILYDKGDRKQGKPMSTVQMQMEILSLRPAELPDYLIWTPGWQQWHPLDQFLHSKQEIFVMAPVVAAPPVSGKANQQNKSQSSKHFT